LRSSQKESRSINKLLLIASALSATAAALHVLIIVGGPAWYLFFGAGRRMAELAAAGDWYPPFITACIAVVLSIWSLYALSGAGLLRPLPLLKVTLCLITAVYLLRGFAIVPIQILSQGNPSAFWWWSSLVCLGYGVVHLIGLMQVWSKL
jgi:hypothetical protein